MDEVWVHDRLKEYLKREERREKSEDRGPDKNVDILSTNRDEILQDFKHKAFEGLLELVDRVEDGVEIPEYDDKLEIPRSFDKIDELLGELYAGNASEDDKKMFLSGLYHSEYFYQRVLMKMEQVQPVFEGLENLSDIKVLSDDQVLANMGIAAKEKDVVDSSNTFNEKFENMAEWLLGWLVPKPKYAYVLALFVLFIVVVIPGTLIVYNLDTDGEQEDLFAEYVYDERVPFSYNQSGLRGADLPLNENELMKEFNYQFNMGLSDYLIFDYEKAINEWRNTDSIVKKMINSERGEEFSPMIRDYYFYLGVSYMAIGRSKLHNTQMREIQFSKAVFNLTSAYSQVQKYNLHEKERELYFIGLVNSFMGNNVKAKEFLNKIEPGSTFYPESQKLIKFIHVNYIYLH